MFGLGGFELAIIAFVVLLLSGGAALPFVAGYLIGKNRGEREACEKQAEPAPPREEPGATEDVARHEDGETSG